MSNFTPQEIEEFLQEFFDVVGARQYVGARYVPIFGRAGEDTVEWDDGAPYEPLTVVMHQGVSYVSRRYVPKDIPITDTDYWVQTYRFNAQVEQYRQEVLGFQSQIDDRIPFPDGTTYPKYGTAGQVLGTLTDGTTEWVDPVIVTSDIAEPLISEWLDDHPEATTTVQDNSVSDAKLTQNSGVLPSVQSISGHLIMGFGRYVDVDTTNHTLTIPQDTVLFCATATRYFTTVTVAQGAPVVIDISETAVATSAFVVAYDLANSEFVVRSNTLAGAPGLVYICSVRRFYNGRPYSVTADFPWSLDGNPYGIDLTIPSDSIADSQLKQNSGVLPSVKSISGHLIMGFGRYVDVDTTNHTLTIPQDTVLFCATATRYFTAVSVAQGAPVVIDISETAAATSAFVIAYDLTNAAFVVTGYNLAGAPGLVYICSVRRFYNGRPYSVTAEFPWSLDGNPYGIDVASELMNYMPYIAGANGTGVRVVNHRGWFEAPENTMPAFKDSARHNYQYVETDIHTTSDGVFVLLHDESINRTARNADGSAISGTVNIASITYAQALTYDFGIYKGAQYAGTKIPTLEEFLVFCHKVGIHPYLELKSAGLTTAQVAEVVAMVSDNGMRGHVSYISYNAPFLEAVLQADPNARVGVLCDTVTAQTITTAQGLVSATNDVFINSSSRTAAEVALCQAANIPMQIGVVNYADMLPSVSPYITGITTDKLDITKLLYESGMGA